MDSDIQDMAVGKTMTSSNTQTSHLSPNDAPSMPSNLKVNLNSINFGLKTNLVAPFPSRFEQTTNDDKEEDIKLEFETLEEDKSHLIRE